MNIIRLGNEDDGLMKLDEVEVTDLTDLELERELERRWKEYEVACEACEVALEDEVVWDAWEVARDACREVRDEVTRREGAAELAWLKTFAKRALEYSDELALSQREYLQRLLEREDLRFIVNPCSGCLISRTLRDELRVGRLDKIWGRLRGHWAPHEYGPLENELEKRREELRENREIARQNLRRLMAERRAAVRGLDTVEDFSMGLVDCEPQVERRRA